MRSHLKLQGFQGPYNYKRTLDPGAEGLHASMSGCALRAHNILRPLYLKILDLPLPVYYLAFK